MARFTHVPVPCPMCGTEVVLPVLSHVARERRLDVHLGFDPMAVHIDENHPDDWPVCDEPYSEH